MPEEREPGEDESSKDQPKPLSPLEALTDEDKEADAGDFIARNVLDKDSVFFEG